MIKLIIRQIKFDLIIVFLLILNLTSCNKKDGDKVYYFFFDKETTSINDSAKTIANTPGNKSNINTDSVVKKQSTVNIHAPYGDMQCSICHESAGSNKLSSQMPDLCYTCHINFSEKYEVLHGPLEIGACTSCHSPHESLYDKLIIREGQELCYYCHNKKDVEMTELHLDIGTMNCWDCHDPHGGSDRTFLK